MLEWRSKRRSAIPYTSSQLIRDVAARPTHAVFVARSICAMSLCKIACSLRLSHLTVRPAQFR
jgi:hypothetical protein